jgi:proteic killer suppression protein
MLVEFEDDDLRRLYEEPDFRVAQIGRDLTKKFRKVVGFVVQASDERDIYAMSSLHFEKLEGDRFGQRSLRLDKQWRLIVRVEKTEADKTIVVIEIVDYH